MGQQEFVNFGMWYQYILDIIISHNIYIYILYIYIYHAIYYTYTDTYVYIHNISTLWCIYIYTHMYPYWCPWSPIRPGNRISWASSARPCPKIWIHLDITWDIIGVRMTMIIFLANVGSGWQTTAWWQPELGHPKRIGTWYVRFLSPFWWQSNISTLQRNMHGDPVYN